MEKPTEFQTLPAKELEEGDFVSSLLFMAKGFLFSCGNGNFYKEATRKKLIVSIFFFFIFACVITSVATLQLMIGMSDVGNEIQGAYDRGEFPTIIIEDGIAEVDQTEPFVFINNRQFVAIDTTGEITEIDTRSYSEGFLLTRTELHFVNEDGYQAMLLSDLHETFGNPIVIDKTQANNIWKTIAIWIGVLAFIGLLFWNTLVRFTYIMLIGLPIWGIVSLSKKDVSFSLILSTGIFATVPVVYLKFLLDLANVNFFSLYTILFLIAWGLALRAVFKEPKETPALTGNEI